MSAVVDELGQVGTHDSEFTYGYVIGCAVALSSRRLSFELTVPARRVERIREIVENHGGSLTELGSERNQYCVWFVHVRAEFP